MPIEIRTIDGFPLGTDLASPVNDLDDNHARYLRDFLLDEPTLTTMRGPIKKICNPSTTVNHIPVGGIFQINANSAVSLWGNYSSGAELAYVDLSTVSNSTAFVMSDFTVGGTKPFFIARPALGFPRAMWCGATKQSINSNSTLLALWGACTTSPANSYSFSFTVARGSTSVTVTAGTLPVSWQGMFLKGQATETGNEQWIGQIKTATGATATLYEPSPFTVTAQVGTLKYVRPFLLRVGKGRITTSTASTTVTGANTKFKDQGLSSGTWYLFKRDGTYVGSVSSVATNTGLTLGANAAVAMSNESYFAIQAEHWDDTESKIITGVTPAGRELITPGWITATYANRQWYASKDGFQSRVWFSDPAHAEMVDFSTVDGDFFDITSSTAADTPITNLFSTTNVLLVMKETELYGIYGNSPSSFTVRRLGDQGCIAPGSVVAYEGGVLWAGRKGVHFFNGSEVVNLTSSSLGDEWEQMLRNWDVTTDRMYGSVYNNHYFLYIDPVEPTRGIKKVAADTIPTTTTLAINLKTRAVTFLTNAFFIGTTDYSPTSTSVGTAFLVPTSSATPAQVYARELFYGTGLDDTTCRGEAAGPKPYIESKKYSLDDPQIKKLIKQVQMMYKSAGDTVTLETVTGLNETGSVSVSTFAAQATYANKRIKFLKRSQYLAFRIYATNNTMTQWVIGPMAIGFKYQRPGRV